MNKLKPIKADNIDPLRMMQRVIDKSVGRNQITLHKMLMYEDLTPEQMHDLSIIRATELALRMRTKNLSELYAKEDMISALRMQTYDVEDYLSKLTKQVANVLPDEKLSITVKCAEECKCAVFDAMRLSTILYNLFSNAVIHNRKKSKRIKLDAYYNEDDFVIRVSDNGRCISGIKQKTLFSKDGIRFDGDGYDSFGVRGLGLVLCRKAAKEMMGDISYIVEEDTNVFEITIPQTGYGNKLNETATVNIMPEMTEMYMAEAFLNLIE